mgnify:FL=1
MLPVRCFTCNRILGHYSDAFETGAINKSFLQQQKIHRYCCQKILLTSVDIHEHLLTERTLPFSKIKPYLELKKIVIAR